MGESSTELAELHAAIAPYYSVHEIAYRDCPAYFFVGVPTPRAPRALRDPPRLATGRAITRDGALLGCLGEVAESLCLTEPKRHSVVRAPRGDLTGTLITVEELAPFGPKQREHAVEWNEQYGDHDRILPPLHPAEAIDWIELAGMEGDEHAYAPAACCYLDYEPPNLRGVMADSNGCAAGRAREEAVLRGLLELVERDATGIWWYGMHRRPAIDPDEIQDEHLRAVLSWHVTSGRQLGILDLATDLAIPVYACVSSDEAGRQVALGFGASLDPAEAAASAVMEMLQLELSMSLVAKANRSGISTSTRDETLLAAWTRLVNMSTCPHLHSAGLAPAPGSMGGVEKGAGAIETIRRRLGRAGLAGWVLDMSRDDLPVHVVRTMVPGLCHYKARLGARRIYAVPITLAWPHQPTSEEQLNPIPLLI